jgi:hypothetical protein
MFGIAPLASLQVTPIESACEYAEGRDNGDDHDDLCRHRTNSIWFIGAIKRDSSPPDFDLDQTECRKFTMAWNQGANFARAHICVRSIRLPSCRGILLKEPLSLSEALVRGGRDAVIWPIADCEEARNVRGGLSSTGPADRLRWSIHRTACCHSIASVHVLPLTGVGHGHCIFNDCQDNQTSA